MNNSSSRNTMSSPRGEADRLVSTMRSPLGWDPSGVEAVRSAGDPTPLLAGITACSQAVSIAGGLIEMNKMRRKGKQNGEG